MNKKDCEHLGYLLATNIPVNWHLCQKVFDMDERIEPEYELFQEAQGQSDEIIELTEDIMIKCRYKRPYVECLDEARKTVLGDDYDPSLFRK